MTCYEFGLYTERAANLATVFGVIFAIGTVYMGWQQLKSQRRVHVEATAKQLLARAIEMCVQYPQYAEPDDYTMFSKRNLIAYRWFVGGLLNTCEEILLYSQAQHWKHEIYQIIEIHRNYLESQEFWEEDVSSFGPSFRAFIREALGRC